MKFKIIILACLILVASGIIIIAFWRYNRAMEATIILEAPKTVNIGEEINIPLKINTARDSINAAEIYLKFNPEELEVVSLSKDSSIFSLWIKDQPAFSNESGEISFAGGLPNPGFKGIGQIGTIKIKTKKKDNIIIDFDQKSRTLLNDGIGTEIKLKLDPIKIKSEK